MFIIIIIINIAIILNTWAWQWSGLAPAEYRFSSAYHKS